MICEITVRKFCDDDFTKIENYEKVMADSKTWQCHHRLETHNSDGQRRIVDITKKELIALDMYYNRPADELIFLTNEEHVSLHHKGKYISEEYKKKLSESNKGKNKGKHWKLVDGKRVWY